MEMATGTASDDDATSTTAMDSARATAIKGATAKKEQWRWKAQQQWTGCWVQRMGQTGAISLWKRCSNKSNTFSMCLLYSITRPTYATPKPSVDTLVHGGGIGLVCWVWVPPRHG